MIVTSILVSIYTFLWTLLLIIPGIIKSISYQRAIYNSHNDESISSGQAIKDSMNQMNGLKSTYFISRIFISLPNLLITFILGYLSISHFTDVISVKYHMYTNFTIMTLIMLVVSVITTVALSIFDGVFNSEMENKDSRY